MQDEEINGTETWLNASNGWAQVLKFDRRGEVIAEMVRGGKKFSLSRTERLLNQDRAASTELDLFANGTLSPVRLVDGTDDAEEFASNPNLMSESDMRELLKAHWKTFESKIKTISNPITLNRIIALSDEADASVRQVNCVQARLSEVVMVDYEEVTTETVGERESNFRAVTPR